MNKNIAEILERYPVDLAAMTDEITKAVKSLEGMMEKKRPAEGPPNPVPVEPKRVKYQHPDTKEEFEGTEAERDQQMASWWAGIAAKSGSAPSNPGQPMPPSGLTPPSGTPMTPMSFFFLDFAALVVTTVAVMELCCTSHRLITRSHGLVTEKTGNTQSKTKKKKTNKTTNTKPTKRANL